MSFNFNTLLVTALKLVIEMDFHFQYTQHKNSKRIVKLIHSNLKTNVKQILFGSDLYSDMLSQLLSLKGQVVIRVTLRERRLGQIHTTTKPGDQVVRSHKGSDKDSQPKSQVDTLKGIAPSSRWKTTIDLPYRV